MTSAGVAVRGLVTSYGEVDVLRGVDLDVPRGAVLALLGRNGAGKTTLVRVLATLLRPDAGTAVVDGFDVVAEPGRVREVIGLTGQFAAVDDRLTARENLVLIARLLRLPRARRVADEALERFGLTAVAGRRAATFSGGMRRRLDLAMSLLGGPRVLFLDEPTTGLDPQSRLDLWALVEDVAASGTTVLLTTQQLEEAERLADRVAVLHEGRVLVEGSVPELQDLLPHSAPRLVEERPTLEDVFLHLTGSSAAVAS